MKNPACDENSGRPETDRAGKGVVLVVDDNRENRDLLAEALAGHGYKVLQAGDGFEAYKAANEKKPDLILLDVMMPGIDGFKVCEKLKKNPPTSDIPVIFATALAKTGDLLKGFEAGGMDYVTKPVKIAEVLARVDTHVRLKKLEEEREQALRRQMENRHWESINAVTEGLAHNFNNLLASVMGNVQFALGGKIEPDISEALDDSLISLKKIENLVSLMQSYRELKPGAENWSTEELIRKMVEMFCEGPAGGVEFDVDLEQCLPDLPPGASCHLRQALEAVMTNAAEAMKNSGRVELRAGAGRDAKGRESIIIEVRDSGPGLEEDMEKMAFLPFHSTKGNVGVGLGLYAAKLSIERVGGTITLSNNRRGGATATIRVPAKKNSK